MASEASCWASVSSQQQQPAGSDACCCAAATQLLACHCWHARPGTSKHLFEIDKWLLWRLQAHCYKELEQHTLTNTAARSSFFAATRPLATGAACKPGAHPKGLHQVCMHCTSDTLHHQQISSSMQCSCSRSSQAQCGNQWGATLRHRHRFT